MYKTNSYYEYMEAFLVPGCPICHLKKKWLIDLIDAFLYESVNDRNIRKTIKANGGICNFHSWKTREMGDPLAHAILYSDLIEDYASNMDAKKKPGCFLCDKEVGANLVLVKDFIQYFEQDELFENAFSKSSCLCRPHLKKVKQLCKNSSLIKTLCTIQAENLMKIRAQLEEIKRKTDYRYANEQLTEGEKTAWVLAVELMTGEKPF